MSLDTEYKKILNPKAFVNVNKTDFKEQYKGKIPFDLEDVWEWIKSNRGSKTKSKK
jgi:hypothetical protein